MEAREVLKRYGQGERDFRGADLRGQILKGAVLSGADFSDADIREANFENAILEETNFSQAKAGKLKGLVRRSVIGWFAGAFALGLFIAFWAIGGGNLLNTGNSSEKIAGFVLLVFLITIGIFWFYKLPFSLDIVKIEAPVITGLFILRSVSIETINIDLIRDITLSSIATIEVARRFLYQTVAAQFLLGKKLRISLVATAILSSLCFIGLMILVDPLGFFPELSSSGGDISFLRIFITIVIPVSISIGYPFALARLSSDAIKGNTRNELIYKIRHEATIIAAEKGTSFYNADVAGANFSQANLENTDLRVKNLPDARWEDAVNLDKARVDWITAKHNRT